MIADILKTLADDNRLKILKLLYQTGELCVCNIENVLELNQSNASKHLNRLRRDGFITKEKRAQWAWYRINKEFLAEHEFVEIILNKEIEDIKVEGMGCSNG